MLIIMLVSCSFFDSRKQGLARPAFETQKTYFLEKFVFMMFPSFNIYSTKYRTFFEEQDEKNGILFKASKLPTFGLNKIAVENVSQKVKYILEEERDPRQNDKIIYSISKDKTKFCQISEKMKNDIYKFDIVYLNTNYSLEGKINQFADAIHSFDFVVKKDGVELCHIFKEFYFFQNEYEIIINRKANPIDDLTYITFSLFIDQILKENGLEFKK